jgi:hypothetical protein
MAGTRGSNSRTMRTGDGGIVAAPSARMGTIERNDGMPQA